MNCFKESDSFDIAGSIEPVKDSLDSGRWKEILQKRLRVVKM